ncbi:hypothetical protein [Metallosphaera hakonensis]|uniref:DUF35 domain-containing protein n=1 Tax=Metallosphaera hakonensis JCM 8857 = DSM 7519 TaxID=1293036 RepID=A0A2U9IWK1_9CREN|nr:hypothetical protein [Metallosphaera hakonensis]AWS00324.1 hypothetical protein DFR87_12265 [Metallosphaera hakonensis JCM 8857 = DSM 7519]
MIYVCNSCGKGYFEPRGLCSCGSDGFREEKGDSVKVYCVKLYVTPSGFPDQLEFCLSVVNGVKVLEQRK